MQGWISGFVAGGGGGIIPSIRVEGTTHDISLFKWVSAGFIPMLGIDGHHCAWMSFSSEPIITVLCYRICIGIFSQKTEPNVSGGLSCGASSADQERNRDCLERVLVYSEKRCMKGGGVLFNL
jgi:hypothetical protein